MLSKRLEAFFKEEIDKFNCQAIELIRFVGQDDIKVYNAVTFPDEISKNGTIKKILNQCDHNRGISYNHTDTMGYCSILDEKGDLLGEIELTQKGVQFLIKSLKLKPTALT